MPTEDKNTIHCPFQHPEIQSQHCISRLSIPAPVWMGNRTFPQAPQPESSWQFSSWVFCSCKQNRTQNSFITLIFWEPKAKADQVSAAVHKSQIGIVWLLCHQWIVGFDQTLWKHRGRVWSEGLGQGTQHLEKTQHVNVQTQAGSWNERKKTLSFCLDKLHVLWEYDKVISVVAAPSTPGSLCHLTQQICDHSQPLSWKCVPWEPRDQANK